MGCARSSPAFNYYTRIKPHRTVLLKSPTVKGFTANNLRGSVRFGSVPAGCGLSAGSYAAPRQQLARRLARGASAEDSIRDGPGVLSDGSLAALRQRIRFETGLASCPTVRSRRFGGGCDSRRARRLARRLARGASAEDSIRDGPDVLPDGSLLALRRIVQIETGPASCPTARSCIASADGSRRARRLARRLAHVSLRRMPNGSRDNCLTGKIR